MILDTLLNEPNKVVRDSIFLDADLYNYITKCKELHISPDLNICNTLTTKYHTLEPSSTEIEAKFLPLLQILKNVNYVTKIKLPEFKTIVLFFFDNYSGSSVSGNSDVNLLGKILIHNKSIKEIDASYHNVKLEGLHSLCQSIEQNSILEKLNISGNYIGSSCVDGIVKMVLANNSLKEINIQNMNIEYNGVQEIQKACDSKPNPVQLHVNGNYVYEERLNVWTHVIGLAIAIRILTLLYNSIEPGNTLQAFSRMTLGLSLVLLYTASCMFHAVHQSSPYYKNIFDSLDHISIYVLIAGHYAPMCIEVVGLDNTLSMIVLVLEYGIVFFGMLMNISFFKYTPAVVMELFFYLAMGWLIVLIIPEVISKVFDDGLYYLVGGGLFLTVGVIFFKLGETIPIYHVVWHVFVIFGSNMVFIALFYKMDIGDGKTMSSGST